MLTYAPEKRPSAQEVLAHEWFTRFDKGGQALGLDVLQRLGNFQVKCKLQYAIMTFIVTQIEKSNELLELLEYFREIDKDKNGVIARDELAQEFIKRKYLQNNELAESEIAKIIEYLDANMSGHIDFTEFVLAAVEKDKLLSEQNLRNCFKMFDRDADGYLSVDELRDVMEGLDADEERWTILLKKIDVNSDGKVIVVN
jgi:calcium-dependent protein kinase